MNNPLKSGKQRMVLAGIVSLALFASACGSDEATESTSAADTTLAGDTTTSAAELNLEAELNASGATFPKTFYEEAIAAFTENNDGVVINYAGGGSGKGRQDLADQIVDWAGTDGTIKDEDLPGFKGGDVLYFPTVVAPITVSYNLGVDDLQLSPATIAKIFQRDITVWNDAAIAEDNPGVDLPDTPITVVHRSDSSGTTSNFTKFLEKSVGTEAGGIWTLGTDSTVEWPADTQAGEGNGGVAQIVQSTDGAIGYVDLSDATDAGLKMALVGNAAGEFVAPTLEGASAAAASATINDNLTFSAIWAEGADAYPITAQTWIIVYKVQTDAAKGEAVKAFINYLLTEGQTIAPEVNYAPLPAELAAKAIAQLDQLEIG